MADDDYKDFEAVLDVIRYARGRFEQNNTVAVIEIDVSQEVFWNVVKYLGPNYIRERRGVNKLPYLVLEGVEVNMSYLRDNKHYKYVK